MPRLNSLCSRLYSIEDKFLAAIDGDDQMMEAFCDAWASLRHDIKRAEATGILTQQMAELAQAVSIRINTIAQAFRNMDEVAQQLSNELDHELELLVSDSIQDETRSKDERCSISRSAPYIRLGYAWLLENLHNPYPSKEVKEIFAKQSGSSVKLIDGWFVDVRKRIGWSKIKRECFQNKRKPLIDAATRFFVTGQHLPASLEAEFAEMAGIAKDLYSRKFCQSEMATKLVSKLPDRPPSPSQSRPPYIPPTQPSRNSSFSSPDFTERNDVTNSLATFYSAGTCDVLSTNRKRVRSEDTPGLESRGNKRVRCESSPKPLSQRTVLSPTPSLTAFQSSPSLAGDAHQLSPAEVLQIRRLPNSPTNSWAQSSPAGGSTTVLPEDPREHVRKSYSPLPIIDDSEPVLRDSAVQFLLQNPSTDESTACAVQTSSHLPNIQPDYALSSMTYPLSTEVSGRVQPTEVHTMGLSLFSNDLFQNYQLPPPPSDSGSLFTLSSTLENPPALAAIGSSDISLSNFLDGTLSDDQLLDSFPMPSDLDSIISPSAQFDTYPAVDISLSTFFNTLPTSYGRLPEPLVGDLVDTAERGTKYPGQAKKLAQLEQLRRYGTHVQECIKSLERQIAA